MSKLKVFYIFSLAMVAGLLFATVYVVPSGEKRFSEVQRDQLLEKDNEWIIQFDIINREGVDTDYVVNVLLDGKLHYTQPVTVRSRSSFSYISHVYKETFRGDRITFAVYKGSESTPIEETTYFVKFQGGGGP